MAILIHSQALVQNGSNGEGQNSGGAHTTSRIWNTLLQAVANFDHTFDKHGVSAMLGFSSEQSSLGYKTEQSFSSPFPNDAITGTFDGSKVNRKLIQ